MSKDGWDKFKISSEALKANWPIIVLGFGAISSGLTNLNQYFIGQEDDFMKDAMKDQITVLAETYVKPEAVKTTIIKSNCNQCMKEVKRLRSEFHD